MAAVESTSDDRAARAVAGSPPPVVVPPALAADVAEAVHTYCDGLLIAERGRLADGSQAVRAAPLLALVRQLRAVDRRPAPDPEVSAAAHSPLPPGMVALEVWATGLGRSIPGQTVRRWARSGRLAGARKVAGRWFVPVGTPDPRGR